MTGQMRKMAVLAERSPHSSVTSCCMTSSSAKGLHLYEWRPWHVSQLDGRCMHCLIVLLIRSQGTGSVL